MKKAEKRMVIFLFVLAGSRLAAGQIGAGEIELAQATQAQTGSATTSSAPASLPVTNTQEGKPSIPSPIAIVPMEGVTLSGAVEIPGGKASIENNGSVMAGEHSVNVILPHRGALKICPTTKLNLLTDFSVGANLSPNESPGLMMALDRGAFEGTFTTRQNSDVVLTPGFRIVISGPGIADLQIRLGRNGDLCVGNSGTNAPYVTVSSIFEGGVYRVNANQRVTFQNGNLNEVVDREKELCGCPSESAQTTHDNEFPVAQSEGLAPLPAPPPNATAKGTQGAQATAQLAYHGDAPDEIKAKVQSADNVTVPVPAKKNVETSTQKSGVFRKIGHFFKKLFGG